MLKKSLTAGFALLLPLFLTFLIIRFFIHFLTSPFITLTASFLDPYLLLFFNSPTVYLINQTLILFLLFLFILATGIAGKLLFLDSLSRLRHAILQRVPFLKKLYMICHEIISRLFSSPQLFSQAVLVPFPTSTALTIGFVSSHSPTSDQVTVFIPSTPNPCFGLTLVYRRQEVTALTMSVEKTWKFLMAGGTLQPEESFFTCLNRNQE